MGTCLETFGLPVPDVHKRVPQILKVIAEEIFDVESQREISSIKSEKLDVDQQHVFVLL